MALLGTARNKQDNGNPTLKKILMDSSTYEGFHQDIFIKDEIAYVCPREKKSYQIKTIIC